MLPFILIHGFPLDSKMWRPQINVLLQTGRPILPLDLPGFGESVDAPCKTIDEMAEYAHNIITTLQSKVIIAGLSMGGYVALALLRNYPDDAAAAIFVDTRADADSPEAKQNRMNAIAEIKANGPAKVYDGLLARLVAPGAAAQVKADLRKMMERQNPETVIAAQQAMANRRDQTDLLSQLKIPALFIVGAHDVITPPAVARAMCGQTPRSTLVEIPDAGHMSNLENPAAVNAALETFLKSLP